MSNGYCNNIRHFILRNILKSRRNLIIILLLFVLGYIFINKLLANKALDIEKALIGDKAHQTALKNISDYVSPATSNDKIIFKDKKIVIGGCARNVQQYLPLVFNNILKVCKIFSDCRIIIYHDKSKDYTLYYLEDYEKAFNGKLNLINHTKYVSRYRTHRLAFGRNKVVEMIENQFGDFDLFINLDLDDVSSNPINIDNLIKTIQLEDKYDVASFARSDGYYDIWALRYDKFLVNQHDISKNDEVVVDYIKKK